MSALTKEFLESIGVQLDDEAFAAFAEHFDSTLKERILTDIVDELDDEQLVQLEQLKNSEGDELWRWIQTNVKDLSDIISEEVDILLGDVAENADSI
ncbi:MAG TPA: hypothetical protein VMT96_00330 [Candidatus Bathyarchaeia archaeon]|nr:hypothetical protein [Candidatus Bathyarchaeia archaeon]